MVASSSIHHGKEEVEGGAPVLCLLAEASKGEEDEANKMEQDDEANDEPGLEALLPPELSRTVTCASVPTQKEASWTKQEEQASLWDADDLAHLNTLKGKHKL